MRFIRLKLPLRKKTLQKKISSNNVVLKLQCGSWAQFSLHYNQRELITYAIQRNRCSFVVIYIVIINKMALAIIYSNLKISSVQNCSSIIRTKGIFLHLALSPFRLISHYSSATIAYAEMSWTLRYTEITLQVHKKFAFEGKKMSVKCFFMGNCHERGDKVS